jgi:DmsE family decaheme c-type cytochrome
MRSLMVMLALAACSSWLAAAEAKDADAKADTSAAVEATADEAAPAATAVATPAAAQSDDSGYSVPGTCTGCHTELVAKFAQGTHGRPGDPRNPASNGSCEACHGSMAAHAANFGGVDTVGRVLGKHSKLSPAEQSAVCLKCHGGLKMLDHWQSSTHQAKGVSCVDCHAIHGGHAKNLAKEDELKTCGRCHQDKVAQMNRSSHHPLIEGKMTCTDCHLPHGTSNSHLLKANGNQLCFTCHAEKRGPFLWQHKPVEEDCLNCHTPHGSSHNKLLSANTDFLCQSCHDSSHHPSTLYGPNKLSPGQQTWNNLTAAGGSSKIQMVYRGCINCHANIHGSNHPSGNDFLR